MSDLVATGLGVAYGDRVAVQPLDLQVPGGRMLAVTGPSGAGKSTILQAVAGLLTPEQGTIRCGEQLWFSSAGRRRPSVDLRPRERRIGVVVQEGALFHHLSAWRNVAFAIDDRPRAQRRVAALEGLERLGMAHRADARPARLSGGERQRVALARALARQPTALLLDEPFSALDDATRTLAVDVLQQTVAELQIPAIVVSHDPEDADRLGAAIAPLRAHRVSTAPAATTAASAAMVTLPRRRARAC